MQTPRRCEAASRVFQRKGLSVLRATRLVQEGSGKMRWLGVRTKNRAVAYVRVVAVVAVIGDGRDVQLARGAETSRN